MLFTPLTLRSVTARNRLMVSPMCQYSSHDGLINDWHLVHLGSRAVGGAGIVFTEAAAVSPAGRITPQDLGIWGDHHVPGLTRLATFIKTQGALAGVQLGHTGRKGSLTAPWDGNHPLTEQEGGWTTVSATARPFSAAYPAPRALAIGEVTAIVHAFALAAHRARLAGFQVLEIHAGYGYLLQQFYSALVNDRTDAYGGGFTNRTRLLLEVVEAVRTVWPEELPLFVRLSARDWSDDPAAWSVDDAVLLSTALRERGVDVIDPVSGFAVPGERIVFRPGFQVPFSERIRREAGVMTTAVGAIDSLEQAEAIVASGQADIVALAREYLRNPYLALWSGEEVKAPRQYARAF